jgi:hypothetical protein
METNSQSEQQLQAMEREFKREVKLLNQQIVDRSNDAIQKTEEFNSLLNEQTLHFEESFTKEHKRVLAVAVDEWKYKCTYFEDQRAREKSKALALERSLQRFNLEFVFQKWRFLAALKKKGTEIEPLLLKVMSTSQEKLITLAEMR